VDHFFSLGAQVVEQLLLLTHRRVHFTDDWFVDAAP
jgi:hypothetical protein